MKTLALGILTLVSLSAFAIDGQLDGQKYCRSVSTGGMFGQPEGVRNHCVSFKQGQATDNANTFFGNPPETFTYDLVNSKIFNVDLNKLTQYEVSGGALLVRETGAILKKVK